MLCKHYITTDLSLNPGGGGGLVLSVEEELVEAAVAVAERVGSEGVNLELAGETVVRFVQVTVTGCEETRLQESFYTLEGEKREGGREEGERWS